MVKVTKNIGLQGGILPTYTGKSQASKIKAIPKVMLKTENKILGAMGHVAMSLYNGKIGRAHV